ncbi:sulfite exporter TauE/SafE family protein [Microbispora triticiradicis]|uniref:urease accessory protein UreH domain-containing protein n=1 Tax=Microbispora TaxID=2005 RepID=UPI00142EFD2F|nr:MULTISPECIES: sulfite exporter TauE/SafE family protein [Microbispora]
MNPAALFAGGLVAGLAAGTASCAAVQGGLLIGLVSPGSPGATGAAGTAGTAGTGRASRTTGAARATRDVRDALPAVAAFLTGRLAAHTALGALLGLAGSAVRLGPQTRAALLVAAGIAVTALAVRMLARRGRAGCAAAPPGHLGCSDGDTQDRQDTAHASTTHTSTVRASTAHAGTAHAGTAHAGTARAAGLGLATILMPCGVTVSLEVVAVSAGSAPGGAAVLAGLALGTAPALAALGLLLRGLATTRLAALGGVAALAAGLFTAGSGLRLGDWLPEIGSPAAAAARASIGADGVQRLTIWATDRGFRPGVAVATAGRPVEIVFRTSGDRGCTRAVAVDGRDVVLPVTGARTVRLPARPEGRLRYACGMGMYVGFIEFERPLTSTSSR